MAVSLRANRRFIVFYFGELYIHTTYMHDALRDVDGMVIIVGFNCFLTVRADICVLEITFARYFKLC